MLHSQKRLSRLALRNRSRAKLMETKLRESQQQVDELRSRMHRLEGVLGAQGFQSRYALQGSAAVPHSAIGYDMLLLLRPSFALL